MERIKTAWQEVKQKFKPKDCKIEVNECTLETNSNLEKLRELTEVFADHSEIVSSVYQALLNSDDYVYLADIEEYKILWVNRSVRELHGDDLEGKTCYQVFQGLDSPCPFCTNDKIKEGGRWIWTFHHERLEKDFLIKDIGVRWNNKIVRLEIAIDITGMLKELGIDHIPGRTWERLERVQQVCPQRNREAE